MLFLLLPPLPVVCEELRLSAIGLRLDYPGRNQPRETRWISTVDPKYSGGDTNRAAKAREVGLIKEGKAKTFAISVSERPGTENLFTTNVMGGNVAYACGADPVLVDGLHFGEPHDLDVTRNSPFDSL
jgi:hypothetical protein